MIPYNPSYTHAKIFADKMFERFGLTAKDKSDVPFMRVVARFLDTIGVMDKQTFLDNYTTTIGSRVYLNFEPGSDVLKPESQIALVAHECQHKHQMDTGHGMYSVKYLLFPKCRARFEADALSTTMEVYYACTQKHLDPHKLATSLKSYALSDDLIRGVEIKLCETRGRLCDEIFTTYAGKTAINILGICKVRPR